MHKASAPKVTLQLAQNRDEGGHGMPPQTIENGESHIHLTLVDDEDKHFSYEFSPSTILEDLFNEYAASSGFSLRLLYFSHHGRALPVSSTRKKTLMEMDIHDNDIIKVRKGSEQNQNEEKAVATKGSPIILTVVDEENNQSSYKSSVQYKVWSSKPLKVLFNNYAGRQGTSPRLLRFSHHGRVLFLSSASKKTPMELGIQDNDIIKVHKIGAPQRILRERQSSASKESKPKKKKKQQKSKCRGKNKRKESIRAKVSDEEWKIEHSKILGKVHEELQPSLEQIRRRLNNLAIKRMAPKKRSMSCNSKNEATAALHPMAEDPSTRCLSSGGKAGRSAFMVQVGAVGNLYKTAKASAGCIVQGSRRRMLRLDLHGLTRCEALSMLEDSLEIWVDAAMQGSYPFVVQVEIVCGCGNQILSETVQEWIKSKRNLCNAPKKG